MEAGAAARPRLSAEYVAGIIDGEGFVGAVIQTSRRSPSPTVVVRLTVTNRHEGLVRAFQAQFGGEAKMRADGVWRWTTNARMAESVIRFALPYLIVKQEQARVCLQIRETMTLGHGVPVPTTMLDERRELYARLRLLNGRRVA